MKTPLPSTTRKVKFAGRSSGGGLPTSGRPWCGRLHTIRLGTGGWKQVHPRIPSSAVWRRDGAELFFVDPRGRLRSVSVRRTGDGSLAFGLPVELAMPPIGFGHWGTQYDVSPDGGRIHFMRRNTGQLPQ